MKPTVTDESRAQLEHESAKAVAAMLSTLAWYWSVTDVGVDDDGVIRCQLDGLPLAMTVRLADA